MRCADRGTSFSNTALGKNRINNNSVENSVRRRRFGGKFKQFRAVAFPFPSSDLDDDDDDDDDGDDDDGDDDDGNDDDNDGRQQQH